MEENSVGKFPGFWHPNLNEGFTKLPHELIDYLHLMDEAELNVILYIMRHTWGFQEFDKPKTITTDEFMYGRKRKDGTRMDGGTGLSDRGVKDGITKALTHGFITCEVDGRDRGRVKKRYAISIYKSKSESD